MRWLRINKTKAIIKQIKQQKKRLKNNNKTLYFSNKHTFSPLHCMIERNYLEQHKEEAGGNLY